MKASIYKKLSLGFMLSFFTISCENFLEVDVPDQKIVSEVVFNNDETALSAMTGIYHQLFQASYSSGHENSVTVLGGLSADELQYIRETDFTFLEFEHNEVLPANSRNLSLWSSAYNIIYIVNSLIEGLENSNHISAPVHTALEGEAKFVRAFTYFYLVNLYGEVPLILTTDYRQNSLALQVDPEEVYQQILLDLTDSIDLLGDEYRDGDRSRVNKFAALALLARVNLYMENWVEAERLSDLVISNTNSYELKEDLDETFLVNSKEALWQISPMGGGGVYTNTNEGLVFLFHPFISSLTKVRLTNELVATFGEEDERLKNWIGYNDNTNSHYAYKYKDRNSMGNITEYSMALRLAEQYLIRSEARAKQNNIAGAQADLDKIRERAGLSLLSETNSQIGEEQLIELILEERRKELFTEWGHRWFDLKRTEKATKVLSVGKPTWQDSDVLYPIPEEERIKNSNLGQNTGY